MVTSCNKHTTSKFSLRAYSLPYLQDKSSHHSIKGNDAYGMYNVRGWQRWICRFCSPSINRLGSCIYIFFSMKIKIRHLSYENMRAISNIFTVKYSVLNHVLLRFALHSFMHTQSLTCSSTDASARLLVQSLLHWIIHSLTGSLNHILTYRSLTGLPNPSRLTSPLASSLKSVTHWFARPIMHSRPFDLNKLKSLQNTPLLSRTIVPVEIFCPWRLQSTYFIVDDILTDVLILFSCICLSNADV
jgi:hypothetical protein